MTTIWGRIIGMFGFLAVLLLFAASPLTAQHPWPLPADDKHWHPNTLAKIDKSGWLCSTGSTGRGSERDQYRADRRRLRERAIPTLATATRRYGSCAGPHRCCCPTATSRRIVWVGFNEWWLNEQGTVVLDAFSKCRSVEASGKVMNHRLSAKRPYILPTSDPNIRVTRPKRRTGHRPFRVTC